MAAVDLYSIGIIKYILALYLYIIYLKIMPEKKINFCMRFLTPSDMISQYRLKISTLNHFKQKLLIYILPVYM